MNAIGVNIIAHKTFRNAAEELLTRNPHFIHELLTELSTFADEHARKSKRDSQKQTIVAQHDTLCRALITGYRQGIEGLIPTHSEKIIPDCEQTVNYLAGPYLTMGYKIACGQIEKLLQRGHHASQKSKPPGPGSNDKGGPETTDNIL